MPESKNVKKLVLSGGQLLSMADIESRDMHWLWYPYIPMGAASMIFGPGGLGKSHIACDIAARVSQGRNLPGQASPNYPQNVLLLSAEDDPAVVLKPRLQAAGADMHRIFVPKHPFILDQRGIQSMLEYMKQATVTLTFIDPMVSYMGGKIDMNKMNEVRTVTGALHEAAMQTGSAIILIHHSRKGKSGEDYEKAAGSADFNNAVRSVMFVQRDKEGDAWFNHVKANYAALGPSLGYHLDKETDRIVWTGAQLLDAPKKLYKAQAWLRYLLKDGPVAAKEVEAAADAEGFNKGMLTRAKDGVAESFYKREFRHGTWYWRLVK